MPRKKKKVDEKQIAEKASKELSKKTERQVMFAVLIMVVLIGVFLLSYFGSKFLLEKMNQFEYKGINFQKDNVGYWAILPIKDMYGNQISTVKVRFWEDPRQTERINVTSPILLTKATAVDLETLFSQGDCTDATQAGETLLLFIGNANLFDISPIRITTTKSVANQLNLTYVNCSLPLKVSAIVLERGNESVIKKEGSCYILEAGNNCEIMNVTERFMIAAYQKALNG